MVFITQSVVKNGVTIRFKATNYTEHKQSTTFEEVDNTPVPKNEEIDYKANPDKAFTGFVQEVTKEVRSILNPLGTDNKPNESKGDEA